MYNTWVLLAWFLLVWTCTSLLGFSQTKDSVVTLPTATLSQTRIRQSPMGAPAEKWSPAVLQQMPVGSIAEVLSTSSQLFLKTYGGGSLATSSILGGSGSQTVVLWNGLPISSPMLGLLDLSLLPVGMADRLSLQAGGNSAAWGGGAIGGIISMDNEIAARDTFQASWQSDMGSFGRWNQLAKIQIGKGAWSAGLRFQHQQAENDFTYRADPSLPTQRQVHARFKQSAIQPDLQYQINLKQSISARAWFQSSFREIPPTLQQRRSEAMQSDSIARVALHWQRRSKKQYSDIKAARFFESILYQDGASASPSQFVTYLAEAEHEVLLHPRHRISGGTFYQHTEAFADGYPLGAALSQLAVHAHYEGSWNRHNWQINGRQEWVNGVRVPFTFQLSWRTYWKYGVGAFAKWSRNYRVPTLNDRFWRPGGNPDLKAEQGYSQEAGWSYDRERVRISQHFFHRLIEDWILWARQPNQTFFSASNLQQVRSYGTSVQAGYRFIFDQQELSLSGSYQYVRSVNLIELTLPRIASGAQLFYTPVHQGMLSMSWQPTADWQFQYRHQWTGATIGLLKPLEGFSTGHLQASFSMAGRPRLQFNSFVDNLWNTSYEIIEWRPMPWRSVRVGVGLWW